METVLYADVLFLVNFAMDFISLSASASLGAAEKRPLRLCIASAIGALYGIGTAVWSPGPLITYLTAAAVGAAMCVISFGFGGIIPFIRQAIIFWGCGALLGGIMTAVLSFGGGLDASLLIPTGAAGCTVLYFVIRAISSRAGCRDMRVRIAYGGRSITFRALCDSGNLLRDPISGKPVILISRDELAPLLGSDTVEALIRCDTETLASIGILPRIIPRGSEVGRDMLCAFLPDSIIIEASHGSVARSALIAPTDKPVRYYGGFSATAPAILIP